MHDTPTLTLPDDFIPLEELNRALRHGEPIATIRRFFANPANFELAGLLDQSYFVTSAEIHFDKLAHHYLTEFVAEPHMFASLQWQIHHLPHLLRDLLSTPEEFFVADIGAGVGAVSSWPILATLAKHDNLARVKFTGYEISTQVIKATRRLREHPIPIPLRDLFGPIVERIIEYVWNRPYLSCSFPDAVTSPSSRYHVVICSFLLHHLNFQTKLNSINRVADLLVDKGLFLLIDEQRGFRQHQEYLAKLETEGLSYGLESFVAPEVYQSVFRDKFHVVSQEKLAGGRGFVCALRKK